LNIQDLGALGELIGGVAVIASVIYLAIQIRHGISGYQSNTILETTHHFSTLQLEIAKSDVLLTAWSQAMNRQPLEPLEQGRVLYLFNSQMIGFENMFFQSKNSMIDTTAYEARRMVIASMMGYTGIWPYWQANGRQLYPADFVADVEQAVKDFDIDISEINQEVSA
jgi:hypothetical protein